jgi:hypothetical protein
VIPFNLKYALIAGGVLVAFIAGWTVNGWRHDAALKKSLQATIELQQAYDNYAREAVLKFQNKQTEQVIVYRALKGEVKNVTDNRICFADNDALQLWNAALTGLPTATAGTTQTTTSTNTVTDTEVLTNVIENFEQAKQIRDQLNALIDWYESSANK